MQCQRFLGAVCVVLMAAPAARAQDQTIVVEPPLQLCGSPKQFDSAALDEAKAEALVKTALNVKAVDPKTYYIIHATEFVPTRMVVAAEHWYVYYKPWQQKSSLSWFRDSRQAKHFKEQRIFGSSRVAVVYLYVNVPTYASREALEKLAEFFLRQRMKEPEPGKIVTRMRDELPETAEKAAENRARARLEAAKKLALTDDERKKLDASADLYLLSAMEAERYLKALSEQRKEIADEFALVDKETGETLTGLSPTLATTATYKSLVNLFYRIDVTKKVAAPVENLKTAAKLAFGAQSGVAERFGVDVRPSSVCAGQPFDVQHIPSDMMVKAMIGAEDEKNPSERSHQLFDNEGRYVWDVSFALPVDFRHDLTINVDAGQVAAKKVDKGDLFAVVNLGMPRDTKKMQWQLIPNFIYGIPITGKPLKHHLVGFTVGLNYVQLLAGVRFDRRQEIGTTTSNGVPVGVEQTPAGDKWEHKWVWGINLPVNTVVKMVKK